MRESLWGRVSLLVGALVDTNARVVEIHCVLDLDVLFEHQKGRNAVVAYGSATNDFSGWVYNDVNTAARVRSLD